MRNFAWNHHHMHIEVRILLNEDRVWMEQLVRGSKGLFQSL